MSDIHAAGTGSAFLPFLWSINLNLCMYVGCNRNALQLISQQHNTAQLLASRAPRPSLMSSERGWTWWHILFDSIVDKVHEEQEQELLGLLAVVTCGLESVGVGVAQVLVGNSSMNILNKESPWVKLWSDEEYGTLYRFFLIQVY